MTGERYSYTAAGKERSEEQKSKICLKYTVGLRDTNLVYEMHARNYVSNKIHLPTLQFTGRLVHLRF